MARELRTAHMVLADLRRRERSRRLRDWRRMIEGYVKDALVSRRPVQCPRCRRMVDMVCPRCTEGSEAGQESEPRRVGRWRH